MSQIAMISFHTCPLASEEGKETGGMNVYVLELSRALTRLGHQVDIFTRSQDVHNKTLVEVSDGLRVVHLVAGPQTPINKKELFPYLSEFVEHYNDFCKDNSVSHTVIHAHYYLSGLIALQMKNRPMILSFHTLGLMKNLVARNIAEKEEDKRIETEMYLGKLAKKIVVPSKSDKNYLRYLYGVPQKTIEVIPPGVNTQLFRPMDKEIAKKHIGLSMQDKMILFVGRIEPLKGVDMLMYAMKIVTQRNPGIRVCLCIVGGDISQPPEEWSDTLQNLNAVRHTLNMSTTVTFVGQKSQELLPYYYNASEMVVMPSHYESFGMSALEAMSCGVPVITTNVAGVSSLIDESHSSLITSVNNPLLLASQIEHLLHSSEKRAIMREEIRKNVLDLSWGNIAEKMSALYREVYEK